jgi:CcmD family protein
VEGSLVYLFVALAIVWVVIIGYLVILGSRLSGLQRELDALKRHNGLHDDDADDEPAAR